jgi:Zn-dependent peptidase ImmA (M78 family)
MAKMAPYLSREPVPVGAIADALSVEVVSITLSADISGLIRQISPQREIYQIQVNNTDAAVRQRFTVAHEIAHYLLHRQQIGTDGITDSILFRSKLSDKTEAEANRLAAAILLPWERVMAWHEAHFGCSPKAEHIDEVARAFKVSSLAVGFRFGF